MPTSSPVNVTVRRVIGSTPTPTDGWYAIYADGDQLPVAAFALVQAGDGIQYPDLDTISVQRWHKSVDDEPRTVLVGLVAVEGSLELGIPNPDTFTGYRRDS